MKLLKNAFLILLAISSHSLSAMRALQKAQKDVAQRAQLASMSPIQRKAVAAAEQEKKATATLKKLRPKGIKSFGSDEKPISLELEPNSHYPTPEALTIFLNTYAPLKTDLPDMPEVIVEKSTEKGARNVALFVAYRNANQTDKGGFIKGKPLFFLKISTDDKDSKDIPTKLNNLQKGPVGRFNLKALSDRELPIIVLQEMFLIYRDNDNKNYTIEVMHIAHGQQVASLIKNNDFKLIQRYAEKVGRALGRFHVYFMNYNNSKEPEKWQTMIHGDFHLGNVLFDEITSRVYFIDNGDMHEDNPFKDLPNIHRMLNHALPRDQNDVLEPDSLRSRQIAFFLSFIEAYLSAYPLAERKLLVPYLRTKLKFDTMLKEYTTKWPNAPDTKFRQTFVTRLNKIFDEACRQ